MSLSDYWQSAGAGDSITTNTTGSKASEEGQEKQKGSPALNSYRNMQRSLNTFYQPQAGQEALRKENEALKEKLDQLEQQWGVPPQQLHRHLHQIGQEGGPQAAADFLRHNTRLLLQLAEYGLLAAVLALSACATSPYTGPVEVTRFVAQSPAGLGQGTIAITFPDEVKNENVRSAFATAVSAELTRLGYTVVAEGAPASQIAALRTTRTPISAAPVERRGQGPGLGHGCRVQGAGAHGKLSGWSP